MCFLYFYAYSTACVLVCVHIQDSLCELACKLCTCVPIDMNSFAQVGSLHKLICERVHLLVE